MLKVYKAYTRSTLSPDTVQLDGLQKDMLEKAKAFCRQIGFDITYDIVIAESLGRGTLGLAEDGRIYLSWRCFDMGTKQVAATLIEEFLHLKHGVKDESRELQDLLLLKLVSLGEELIGEAL